MAVKKWRGKWVVDFVRDDQRIRRVSPVQTKRGAQAYEVELRQELTSPPPAPGAEPVAEVPTFAEFADEWMTTYVAVNNKPSGRLLKESTLRNELVPFFGKRRLNQITLRDIEAFKADQVRKGLHPATVNRRLSILGSLMKRAVEWGVITEIPRARTLAEPRRDFDWLRPDEVGAMLTTAKAASQRYYTFIFVALRTGMRKGEIYGLHWRSVDFDARRITVEYSAWRGLLGTPKSGKTRVVPMTADLAEVLGAWRQVCPGEIVFPSRKGGIVYGTTCANRALYLALERAELRRVRFHDLRHTFASHLVLKGCSLKVVQLLLGHSSVSMTERYAHIADQQLMSAVDVLEGLGTAPKDEEEGEE